MIAVEMVQEFVGQSHGNLERVTEMLAEEPKLLHAAWDWGGGDWETGLGAASHVGRRDIAEFLLSKGARMDIFAATMLGQLEIVKRILSLQPEAWNAPGPHGIPLIVHARMGGAQAEAVLAFLEAGPEFQAVGPIGASNPHAMPVRDVDTAIPFYQEQLGFTLRSVSSEAPRTAILSRDLVTLGLSENGEDPEQASCYLNVRDVDAIWAEFRAKGLDVSSEPGPMAHDGKHYRVFFLRDPDGLCYCISQPAGA